jgi:hypothetical protein
LHHTAGEALGLNTGLTFQSEEEKQMFCKRVQLAMIALCIGFAGAAAAQDVPIPPAPLPVAITVTRAMHNAITHYGKRKSGAVKATPSASGVAPSIVTPAFVTGWNVVHATTCMTYYDGTDTWFYVFPQEGGIYFTNLVGSQIILAPQCVLGQWVAFYVYDSIGDFNRVVTYGFK